CVRPKTSKKAYARFLKSARHNGPVARHRLQLAADLIADRKPLPDVLRISQLIHERDRIVFSGDMTVPFLIRDQLVFVQSKLACSLPRLNEGSRTEICPIQISAAQYIKRIGMSLRNLFIFGWEIRCVDQSQIWSNE